MKVTKDFEKYVYSIDDMDFNEIYELYKAASCNDESLTFYRLETVNNSDDIMIINNANGNALRLTPKANKYFLKWIKKNLMNGLDEETFYGFNYNIDKDDWLSLRKRF